MPEPVLLTSRLEPSRSSRVGWGHKQDMYTQLGWPGVGVADSMCTMAEACLVFAATEYFCPNRTSWE